MRSLVFLCLLAPIMAFQIEVNHAPAMNHLQTMQARIMEDKIIAFLECIREILNKGDPDFGFPSFNPLSIPEANLDLTALNLQGISGHANIKDLHMAGLPGWKLDQLKISVTIIPIGAKVIAKVTWPVGDLSATYDIDATIFDHTIVGKGSVKGDLAALHFELESQAVINPVHIKSAKLKISLGSSKLNLEALAVDGTDIATPLNAFVATLPDFLKVNAGVLDKIVNTIVVPAINKILDAILNGGKVMGYDIPIIGKCLVP